MQPIQSITFVVNTDKQGSLEVAEHLARLTKDEGVASKIITEYPLAPSDLKGQDLCCTVGGDGTLLGVLQAALEADAAVLGVNMGKLGFLATFTRDEVARDLPALIQGNYAIDERSVLECANNAGETALALNDVVIKETRGTGLIRLYVSADGTSVSEYHCDGLIFSTPTGSTAYNLSAGGPIIGPRAGALAMTPICPHTLGNRSVIFDDSAKITVNSPDESRTLHRITIDGRTPFASKDNFPLSITIASRKLRLMQNPDHSHFAIVRNKLNWGDPTIRSQK